MPAYVLMIRERSRDADELALYDELAPSTFKGHPARFLIFHGKPEVLEGAAVEDVMLATFPSLEEARAWYQSDAYTRARQHRHLGGDFRCFFVDGPAS